MSAHVFVDETKHRDYLMVAAVVLPVDLQPVRQLVRSLVLPGQRRIHMKKESEPRKRLIADTIAASSTRAVIFDAGAGHESELHARLACLQAVITYAADLGATRVVFEQDDSLLRWDTQRLVEITRTVGCRDTLQYEHHCAGGEQLLALPDAIAWCWAKGGHWRQRIAPALIARYVV